MKHILIAAISAASLSACVPPEAAAPAEAAAVGQDVQTVDGRCFELTAPPTQTVVIADQIEVAPAVKDADGTVISPPVFRNITRPTTTPIGEGTRFETVCRADLTPAFVATLQRAMITRQAYSGQVTGRYDTATGIAVQRFQRRFGIDSPFLAIQTARQFGVLAVDRDSL